MITSPVTNTLEDLEKMTPEQQYQLNRLPAEVDLWVDDFIDVLDAQLPGTRETKGYRMTMSILHSRVYIGRNDGKLHIRPFGATFRINVFPENYYPIGIAFDLTKGIASPNKLDRLGLLNFDQLRLFPLYHRNALAITDRFLEEKVCEAGNEYKFSVIIQDATTGKIGIIDPMIVHDPR